VLSLFSMISCFDQNENFGLFVYVISGFFALRYVIVSHLFDDVMPTAETWDSIHDSYEFASP